MDSMPVTSAFYTRRFIKQIEEEIPTLIKLQREGTYWDFKQQWHSDRSELKADIICLANNIESSTSYLIFGISDKDFSPVDISDDENRKTQSDIIDMLKNMQWKGGQPPFILMHSMQYENSLLDIIAIKSRPEDMPYMLSKGDANIYANIILNRQGDRNSPKKQGASWREIEAIWRHHFSLGLSPLKQVQLMLRDKENWTLLERDEDDKFIEKMYYDFAPEYAVSFRKAYDRHGWEYYLPRQDSDKQIWYDIEVFYHQTKLFTTAGTNLNEGLFITPAPERSYFLRSQYQTSTPFDIAYCYFIEDSIAWSLRDFYFNTDTPSNIKAENDFLSHLLLFKSEHEREAFEDFLRRNQDAITKRIDEQEKHFPQRPLTSEDNWEYFSASLHAVPVLKEMLSSFRDSESGAIPSEGARSEIEEAQVQQEAAQ